MQIRRIRENDREDYISLVKTFYDTDAVMHPIPEKYITDTFQELMRCDTFARCYIFEHEGKIAGYALTARTFSQEAGGLCVFVEEVFVLPEYRSMGFGSEFFSYLMRDEPDVKRLRLEVEEENPRAIALYKRMGFNFLEYLQMYKEV